MERRLKLAFYFTLTCNARCAHCITSAGPKVARKMTLEQAKRVVQGTARTPELGGIVFTGGENFVHRDELLALIQHCTALGVESEIVSNGFWATSPDAAVRTLAPFKEAGLGVLRISLSRYHLPYVPVARVHAALAGMRAVGFLRHVACVIDQPREGDVPARLSHEVASPDRLPRTVDADTIESALGQLQTQWPPELSELLTDYGFQLADCLLLDDYLALEQTRESSGTSAVLRPIGETKVLILYQFLAADGRGRQFADALTLEPVEELPDVVCEVVGYTPTVNPEGDVFPCPSAWANQSQHAVGNVATHDMPVLMERMKHDPIALFMHHQGPLALVAYLRQHGVELPDRFNLIPSRFADKSHPCHPCGLLLTRFSRAELRAHIEAFYKDNPWRLVFTGR